MRRLLVFLFFSGFVYNVTAQQLGTFKDPRDGKTYKTTKIGTQTWMAENLAYKPSSGNYWAYDDNQSNVAKYGYLYDWQTAKNVCPTGWHLPSDAEWTVLVNLSGGEEVAGTKLKAKNSWDEIAEGINDFGFSALPGGNRDIDDEFDGIGNNGYWWSSTQYNTDDAWHRNLYSNNSIVGRDKFFKGWGFSVRCLKD
jgi:uncharacterized protein (TIGR02145 family)